MLTQFVHQRNILKLLTDQTFQFMLFSNDTEATQCSILRLTRQYLKEQTKKLYFVENEQSGKENLFVYRQSLLSCII
jgi:hypothetical protein